MKQKAISYVIFGLYVAFFTHQLIQFIMFSDNYVGPYAFILSMIVFNVILIIMSKQKFQLLGLIISSFYILWYLIVAITIKEEGFMLGIDLYLGFFKVTMNPATLTAFGVYFSNAIAISVYVLPYIFIINYDYFKQTLKK